MGLFNEVGRHVERFRQTAKETAAESAAYECGACGERFHTDHDECPECGATAVESVAEESGGDESSGDESATDEPAADEE